MDALLAWLWQGCLLTAAVAVALRVAPRASAATRHVVWWVTLACVGALPFVYAAGAATTAYAPAAREVVGTPSETSSALAGTGTLWVPAPPDWVVAIALGGWLGFVLLSAVRIARGVVFVRRLARRGVPIDPEREAGLPLWMRHRDAGRRATLRVSRDVRVPCALGLGHATILLPHRMLGRLPDVDLDQLVMHERAHLLRYDDWTRLAEAIVSGVAGAHPAVGWICRHIDLEREAACDDLVVKETGDTLGYAACLATAASVTVSAGSRSPLLAPGAWHARGPLECRVRRLVDGRRYRRTSASRSLVLASACGLAAASLVLVEASPLVRFASDAPREPAPLVAAVDSRVPTRDRAFDGRMPAPGTPGDSAGSTRGALLPVTASNRGSAQAPAFPESTRRRVAEPPAAVSAQAPTSPRPFEHEPPRTVAPAEQHVVLPSVLPVEIGVPPAPLAVVATPLGNGAPDASGRRSPWSGVAQAGSSVGSGAKKAGVVVATFFTRAGHSVGDAFHP